MDEVKVAMRHLRGRTLRGQLGTPVLNIDMARPLSLEGHLIYGDPVSRTIERFVGDMMPTLLLLGRAVTPGSTARIGEA